jgi:hypothetical protein
MSLTLLYICSYLVVVSSNWNKYMNPNITTVC